MDREVLLKKIKENNIQWIQLHFTDVIGRMRALHISAERFCSDILKNGIGFDGSSVGLTSVEQSDMIAIPDDSTFLQLPHEHNEARVIADIFTPLRKSFPADPRFILKRAINLANEQGYEDIRISPEMEFYVLDESESDRYENIEHQGYFAPPPLDSGKSYRKTLSEFLMNSGYQVKYHHHEKGKNQHEVEIASVDALSAADYCIYFKYLAREVASIYDLMVTFMPKPFSDDAGNGMHAHVSFFKKGKNLFYDENDDYYLSQTARYFIGGILDHAKGMAAIANPTLNSYKRLIPHFEAPVYIAWGHYNRSSLVRIPAKINVDVEIRNADPAANPYLLFAAIIHAGLDGIKKKISYEPIEKNIYEMTGKSKLSSIKKLPTNLMGALESLEQDEIILKALGKEAIDIFIEKKKKELQQYIGEPSDLEYRLYFNC